MKKTTWQAMVMIRTTAIEMVADFVQYRVPACPGFCWERYTLIPTMGIIMKVKTRLFANFF